MIPIFDWLEDWDNADLPQYEHEEQLRQACIDYNERYHTRYDPDNTVTQYLVDKRMRRFREPID